MSHKGKSVGGIEGSEIEDGMIEFAWCRGSFVNRKEKNDGQRCKLYGGS